LAALPGIGPTKAKRIVRYRQGQPDPARAFERPSDLARIHGIGPKTVRRVAPFLALTR
jgi:DNA uptake protein ComE-like DNA-binding protein